MAVYVPEEFGADPWQPLERFGEESKIRDLGPLEGKLVEICGADDAATDRETGQSIDDPNGLRGRACAWNEVEKRYLVDTFSGYQIDVPEDKLIEYEPDASDCGGFDVTWPLRHPHGHAVFSLMVAEHLQKKGYCMIQMFGDAEASESLQQLASDMALDFKRPKKELEEGYLGENAKAKVWWLGEETADAKGVMYYNEYIKKLHMLLIPITGELLGFRPWSSRMATMVRTPFADENEGEALDPGDMTDADITDGTIEKYLDFVQRRRLCMMYMVNGANGAGGLIDLTPRKESCGFEKVSLNIEANRLLIFRHDLLGYSYEPEDAGDLVFQTWVVDPPMQLEGLDITGNEDFDDEFEVTGPSATAAPGPGLRTVISSFHCRTAACGYGQDKAWALCISCTEGCIEMPLMRWDVDYYYSADGDFGKTRTKHSNLVVDNELIWFDNTFYEWSAEFAAESSISARLSIDTGFQTLYNAGFNKDELRGHAIGYYLGHSCDIDMGQGKQLPARLLQWLGLTGRCSVIDTACSSALVATISAHQDVCLDRADACLAGGVNLLMAVEPYIAMSSGRMISSRGRSYTFDHSADGYGRGEGCVGACIEKGDGNNPLRKHCEIKECVDIGRCCSSNINQDGRSASITAPSGPSQQACIKASLLEGGLTPDKSLFTECHGTGTALGDPIEVGSSRSVNDPYHRELPLYLGAAKTNVGHLEMGAGIVGVMKLLNICRWSAVPPNLHVNQLNEHFAIEGFPVCMQYELVDAATRNKFVGVNSFGFGGTNSRMEIWGRARMGPRALTNRVPDFERLNFITVMCPRCLGPKCYQCGVAIPRAATFMGKHVCTAIREDFASYEYCSLCYDGTTDGTYKFGGPDYADVSNPRQRLYVCGSWSNWQEYEELEEIDEGQYEVAVRLGDTRVEEFRIAVEMDLDNMCIHPVKGNANQIARITGPDNEGEGKNWVIDGRLDNMPEGSIYRIFFEWDDSWKRVSWEPTEELLPDMSVHRSNRHTYALSCSFNGFKLMDMKQPDPSDLSKYEYTIRIGIKGEDRFQFIRDRDPLQMIHPAEENAVEPNVNVMGPDALGENMYFLARGAPGELVKISLCVCEGEISVTTTSKVTGDTTWNSCPPRYFMIGSFTGWYYIMMDEDPESTSVWRFRFTIGSECREYFQIAFEQDERRTYYPVYPDCPPGDGVVLGPDAGGAQNWWEILGSPGQDVEVSFDLLAEDKRNLVVCKAVASLDEAERN